MNPRMQWNKGKSWTLESVDFATSQAFPWQRNHALTKSVWFETAKKPVDLKIVYKNPCEKRPAFDKEEPANIKIKGG